MLRAETTVDVEEKPDGGGLNALEYIDQLKTKFDEMRTAYAGTSLGDEEMSQFKSALIYIRRVIVAHPKDRSVSSGVSEHRPDSALFIINVIHTLSLINALHTNIEPETEAFSLSGLIAGAVLKLMVIGREFVRIEEKLAAR